MSHTTTKYVTTPSTRGEGNVPVHPFPYRTIDVKGGVPQTVGPYGSSQVARPASVEPYLNRPVRTTDLVYTFPLSDLVPSNLTHPGYRRTTRLLGPGEEKGIRSRHRVLPEEAGKDFPTGWSDSRWGYGGGSSRECSRSLSDYYLNGLGRCRSKRGRSTRVVSCLTIGTLGVWDG